MTHPFKIHSQMSSSSSHKVDEASSSEITDAGDTSGNDGFMTTEGDEDKQVHDFKGQSGLTDKKFLVFPKRVLNRKI